MCGRQMKLTLGIVPALLATGGVLAGDYEMTRWTIDGGGVTRSIGGNFELSGTIGQPDAGALMTGPNLELTAGFWFRLVSDDCNSDGGVNLYDHADLVGACLSGPDLYPGDDDCLCFDQDGDGDVDLRDLAAFQKAFAGP